MERKEVSFPAQIFRQSVRKSGLVTACKERNGKERVTAVPTCEDRLLSWLVAKPKVRGYRSKKGLQSKHLTAGLLIKKAFIKKRM
eukprot:scaffold243452_cov15-Tisochrysis_lutea.AAC.1